MAALRQDPVVILMTARSGSSMIAAMFAEHGFWRGPSRKTRRVNDRPAYETFEHDGIIKDLGLAFGRKRKVVPNPAKTLEIFERHVPADTPWMFKGSYRWWPALDGVFSGARFVFIHREPQSVARSVCDRQGKSGYWTRVKATEEIYEKMGCIAQERGIPTIRTDAVAAGDYSTLEAAFSHCGLEFDKSIADKCIDQSKWRPLIIS